MNAILLILFSFAVSVYSQQCLGYTWVYGNPQDYARGRVWHGRAYCRGGYVGSFNHDCFSETKAFLGDSSCNVFMPVSCYDSSSDIPDPPLSWYSRARNKGSILPTDQGYCVNYNCDRHSGQLIKLTEKEYNGHCFSTGPADLDGVCASEFGSSWKSTHHHYQSGPSYFGGYMEKPATGYIRVWSYVLGGINPWKTGAQSQLCDSRPADWIKWEDECWARHPCPGFQACHDPDTSTLGQVICGSCDDGIKNQQELGVDCGPVCGNTCRPGNCFDLQLTGDEEGVDCGGSCQPCPESCQDGILNNEETFADCGGPNCPACLPSCWDGIQNGEEEGPDCGGGCAPCNIPACSNGFQDGDEEDIDCGGRCSAPCLSKPSIASSTYIHHYSCQGFRSCPYVASEKATTWVCPTVLPTTSNSINPPFDPANAVVIVPLDTAASPTADATASPTMEPTASLTDPPLSPQTLSLVLDSSTTTTPSPPTTTTIPTVPSNTPSPSALIDNRSPAAIAGPAPPIAPGEFDATVVFIVIGFLFLLTFTATVFFLLYRNQQRSYNRSLSPPPAAAAGSGKGKSRSGTRRSGCHSRSRSRAQSRSSASRKINAYGEVELYPTDYSAVVVPPSNKRSPGYDRADSAFLSPAQPSQYDVPAGQSSCGQYESPESPFPPTSSAYESPFLGEKQHAYESVDSPFPHPASPPQYTAPPPPPSNGTNIFSTAQSIEYKAAHK